MKRQIVWSAALLGAGFVAIQSLPALQNVAEALTNTTAPAGDAAETGPATAKPQQGPGIPDNRILTPMAQRVATIGLLNKRNGLWRDLKMKPGEAVRVGDVVVRLRACEVTAPWETEKYTGAFVQVITRATGTRWQKIFSGWLYKESPSLNVVEHPIYDVWVKDCTMRHPDIGPNTIVARGDESGGGSSATSNAAKSAEAPSSPDEEDDAAASNTE